MLGYFAYAYVAASHRLSRIEALFASLEISARHEGGLSISPETNAQIIEEFDRMVEVTTGKPVPFYRAQAKRLAEAARRKWQPDEMRGMIASLRDRLEDELKPQLFLFLQADLHKYLNGVSLLDKRAREKFPTSLPEIRQAGRCLAFGEDTASVFHLMRAMELVVARLCRKLKIKNLERVWGSLLSEMGGKIKLMPDDTSRRKEKKDAWSEAHSSLYHVKQAWRNKTMHPAKSYTAAQARDVFEAVRAFIDHLAGLL
jgi:hypothetical protein